MAKQFRAIENGTLNNPYRFVAKDSVVELTDEEADFYAKSKWLLPLKKANAIVPPPLMSHMNIKHDTRSSAMDAINSLPVDPLYLDNMKRLAAGEKAADEKTNAANTPKPDEAGTGNQSVI
mgnify:CR=1 FL=1